MFSGRSFPCQVLAAGKDVEHTHHAGILVDLVQDDIAAYRQDMHTGAASPALVVNGVLIGEIGELIFKVVSVKVKK